MKIMINKTKAILSGLVLLLTGYFSIYYFIHWMFPEAPVFLLIAALFGFLFFQNASSVTISDDSVTRSFFGLFKKTMTWPEIKEMGLIGENVFSKKKTKTGDKYLYFSPVAMNKEERFQMIVKWPPKDKLYALYSKQALEYAQTIWGKELKTYNVEDLFPDTKD